MQAISVTSPKDKKPANRNSVANQRQNCGDQGLLLVREFPLAYSSATSLLSFQRGQYLYEKTIPIIGRIRLRLRSVAGRPCKCRVSLGKRPVRDNVAYRAKYQ
jgi:hypothetical protein